MSNLVWRLVGCLLVISFVKLSGQNMVKDTIKIEEVSIVKSRKEQLSEGYQKESLTKRQIEQFANRTLGEVLQYSSGVNVRSYGTAGASASVSFRGLGASQTQINWNGFPINSVTLGSADIANVPVMQDQSIDMVPGASGVNYGSGTFGGALNINYQPELGDSGDYVSGVGMFGAMNSFSGVLNYKAEFTKLNLSGSLMGNRSDGNFKYLDEIEGEYKKRNNSDYKQVGFQQYFSFKNSQYSELKGGIWGSVKDLNLPPIEGAQQVNIENQKDSTLRMFVHWTKVLSSSSISAKVAWFYSDQHYVKKVSPEDSELLIDSRIKTKTWFGDVNYRAFITNNLSADVGVSYTYSKAYVLSYQQDRFDKVFGVITGLKYQLYGHSFNVSTRKEWGSNVDSDVLFGAGFSLKIIKNQLYVRGAYSQKFRRPTFNDLFWIPGGNSKLKPENGDSYELGSSYTMNLKQFGGLELDLSFFYSRINDLIVWRPAGAYWEAQNYRGVITRGIDFKVKHTAHISRCNLNHYVSFSYNKATNVSSDHKNTQLVYAPEFISNLNSNLSYRTFLFDFNWRFVSERLYDDYGGSLDPYWLFGGNISKRQRIKGNDFVVSCSVDNVFNHRYQMIRSYPMPGRLWQVKIKYLVNFNK